jgi:hypothetical protein
LLLWRSAICISRLFFHGGVCSRDEEALSTTRQCIGAGHGPSDSQGDGQKNKRQQISCQRTPKIFIILFKFVIPGDLVNCVVLPEVVQKTLLCVCVCVCVYACVCVLACVRAGTEGMRTCRFCEGCGYGGD